MATDYISREAAIEAVRAYRVDAKSKTYEMYNDGIDTAISALSVIPAADVRSVARGKWEKHKDFDTYGGGRFVEWVCSECDKRLHGDWVIRNSHIEETPTENCCPNCGADMREVHND